MRKTIPNQATKKFKNGQALLEFALIVLLLVLLLFGAFDVGRIYHTKIVIANAAREAARYLVLNPKDNINPDSPFNDTYAAAIREAENSAVSLGVSDISVSGCVDAESPDDGCDAGSSITITISKTYNYFLSDILGTSLPLVSYARMYLP